MGREYFNLFVLFLLQGLRLHFLLRNQSYFPTISWENMLVIPIQTPLGTHKATTPTTDVHVSECSLLTASVFRVGPFSTLLCCFQDPAGLPRHPSPQWTIQDSFYTVITCPLPLLYVCVCIVEWAQRDVVWYSWFNKNSYTVWVISVKWNISVRFYSP